MNISIRQIILGSIPTLAAILGFLWFRRKKKDPALTWEEEEVVEEEGNRVQNIGLLDSKDVSVERADTIPKSTDVGLDTTQVVTCAEVHSIVPSVIEKPDSVVDDDQTALKTTELITKTELEELQTAPCTSEKPFSGREDGEITMPATSIISLENHILPHIEKVIENAPVTCESAETIGDKIGSSIPAEVDRNRPKTSTEQEESNNMPGEVRDEAMDTVSTTHEAKASVNPEPSTISENLLCSNPPGSDSGGSEDDSTLASSSEESPSSPTMVKAADENANLQSVQSNLDLLEEPVCPDSSQNLDHSLSGVLKKTSTPQPESSANNQTESETSNTGNENHEAKSRAKDGLVNGDVVHDHNAEGLHNGSGESDNVHKGEKLQNGSGEVLTDKTEKLQNGSSSESGRDKVKQAEQNNSPAAGDCDHLNSDAQSEVSSDSGRGASGIETPTATSPSELNEYTVYEFDFPTDVCGRLIGRAGKNINSLKTETGAEIVLRRKAGIKNFQTCSIEGTQSQVRATLELIKTRFPAKQYPDITYEQTNLVDESPVLMPQVMQLNLPEGVSLDVIVSSVVDANHVFLQQVTHPTFPSLEKLSQCMAVCYTHDEVPELPRPIETGMICAAPMYAGWYRAMVTGTYPDSDEVEIKYIDYGGYMKVAASLLRQIRADFMGLPFQATECFLANVIPLADEEVFGIEASACLESLVQGMLLQAQIVGRSEDGTPYIELYSSSGPQVVFINRELVNMGVARWIELQA